MELSEKLEKILYRKVLGGGKTLNLACAVLNEFCQRKIAQTIICTEAFGPAHQRSFVTRILVPELDIAVLGCGSSKKEAKLDAACEFREELLDLCVGVMIFEEDLAKECIVLG